MKRAQSEDETTYRRSIQDSIGADRLALMDQHIANWCAGRHVVACLLDADRADGEDHEADPLAICRRTMGMISLSAAFSTVLPEPIAGSKMLAGAGSEYMIGPELVTALDQWKEVEAHLSSGRADLAARAAFLAGQACGRISGSIDRAVAEAQRTRQDSSLHTRRGLNQKWLQRYESAVAYAVATGIKGKTKAAQWARDSILPQYHQETDSQIEDDSLKDLLSRWRRQRQQAEEK